MIGKSISSITSQRPREVDVLRLYFNFPLKTPENNKVTSIIEQIEGRYREIGVRIKGTESIRIKLKRLVKACKGFVAKRKVCRKSIPEKQRQEEFHTYPRYIRSGVQFLHCRATHRLFE